jgi:hypothetical protein
MCAAGWVQLYSTENGRWVRLFSGRSREDRDGLGRLVGYSCPVSDSADEIVECWKGYVQRLRLFDFDPDEVREAVELLQATSGLL